jgi:hypothetical protein
VRRDRPSEELNSLVEVQEDLMVGVGVAQRIHCGNVDRLKPGFDLVDLEESLVFVAEALVGSLVSDLEGSSAFAEGVLVGLLASDLEVSLVVVVADLEVFGLVGSLVAEGQEILAEVFGLEVSSGPVVVDLDSSVCYQPETLIEGVLASFLAHVAFLDHLVQLVSLVYYQREMKGKVVLGYLAYEDLDSYRAT